MFLKSFWLAASPVKKGWVISFSILIVTQLLWWLRVLFSYHGTCGANLFFGGIYQCSYFAYLREGLGWMFVFGLAFWRFLLAALLVPPLIGLIIGKMRRPQ